MAESVANRCVKGLALGATVLSGAVFYGLGAEWRSGVAKVVDILQREFAMAMVLTGRTNIASIDRSVIWS
jgi:isopentenyl diphosphate isomerase/L-lactate dehydrogenase-like FMN-dependent dehydrogenase